MGEREIARGIVEEVMEGKTEAAEEPKAPIT